MILIEILGFLSFYNIFNLKKVVQVDKFCYENTNYIMYLTFHLKI